MEVGGNAKSMGGSGKRSTLRAQELNICFARCLKSDVVFFSLLLHTTRVLVEMWGIALLLLFAAATSVVEVPRVSPISCGETNTQTSKRIVQKHFLSTEEVDFLAGVAERGMGSIPELLGGPTIMDPDQNLVLGPGGKVKRIEPFSTQELSQYAKLMQRLHEHLLELHGLTTLYHTAPTFIARLLPVSTTTTSKRHVHDEYWHEHCDKNNTEHYDYSALVYLTDHGRNFTGGEFEFTGSGAGSQILRPEAGMLVTFASGVENPHKVNKVTSGKRLAWSTWWTCSKQHRFLDSKFRAVMENTEL